MPPLPAVPKAPTAAAFRPSGVVRHVHSGQSIASVVQRSANGDTVVLHAGTYPQVVLTRRFPTAVRITGADGEDVTVGGFVVSGGSGYLIDDVKTDGESRLESDAHDVVFNRVRCAMAPAADGGSCFYFSGTAHRAVLSRSSVSGGWDGVKLYGCEGSRWASDIRIVDNEIVGAYEDDIHVNCATNVTIEHNLIRDPVDNDNHNDGVQSQASYGLRIVRNTFTFGSVPPRGGPNQAIMLGNVPDVWPDRKVVNTLVAGNLVHHWNAGRPLIMNGTEGTRIVNNTFVDSGNAGENDPSITVANQGSSGGQNPGLEIWNNILKSVLLDSGSIPPAFFSTNLITSPFPHTSGRNVIRANPRFVDRARYGLGVHSPARGRGIERVGTPTTNIDGVPWPTRARKTAAAKGGTRIPAGISLGAR